MAYCWTVVRLDWGVEPNRGLDFLRGRDLDLRGRDLDLRGRDLDLRGRDLDWRGRDLDLRGRDLDLVAIIYYKI
mgnify:CR=1 FL=1